MTVRSLLAALTAATALLATPATAAVPRATPVLTASSGDQRGVLVRSTSGQPSGHGCSLTAGFTTRPYPTAVRHDGTPVSWRIPDSRRPVVEATLTRLGSDSTAAGPGERLTVSLSPVRSGRKVVAWTARTPDVGYGDLHLDVTVTWPGNRCGDDDATYLYRLLSLPV